MFSPTPISASAKASNAPIGCENCHLRRRCSSWEHAGRRTRPMHAGTSGDRWTETRTSPSEPLGERLDLFATAAPGLEPLVERELRALAMNDVRVDAGGVAFTGGREAVYRANLHLRTASRVVARVAEFGALDFPELVRQTKRQPWERYLDPERLIQLRVTCKKSRLYHSDAVAERVADGIEKRIGIKGVE